MAEHSSRVVAGPVSFVVDHRRVGGTGGPTVRVMGSDDHEYLKFDMFQVNAHYHYEPPGTDERIVGIDTVAVGDAVEWVMERLRQRLAPMLTEAGGGSLTDALDDATLTDAIADVEALVRQP
ncbi:MAG TPA: hypothetical protein VH986_14750 [Acidimicrobiia bacterium]